MGCVERDREVKRRRNRKAKLKKFRAAYAKLTRQSDKDELLAKARVISPFVSFED